MSHLKKDLREAAQIVQRNSLKEQTRHAKLYNRKVKGSPLVVGDRVLIANRGVPGKRKVADKWESTPYEVMSVKPEINVYRVRDSLTGRERESSTGIYYSLLASCPVREMWTVDLHTQNVMLLHMEVIYALLYLT